MEGGAGTGIGGVLGPFPPVTRLCTALLGLLLVVALLFPSMGNTILALHPGYVGPPRFYVWTLLTSGFYDNIVINAVLNIGGMVFFGRYLEPLWGKQEMLRFILVVNLITGLATFLTVTVLYLALKRESLLVTPFCSFSGAIVGFAVALKQLIPETELRVLGVVPLRAKFFPLLITGTTVVLALVGLPPYTVPHTLYGLLFSWSYLRLAQRKGELTGDASDSFAFVTLFPEPVQPLLSPFFNLLGTLCMPILGACCGLGKPTGRSAEQNSSNINVAGAPILPVHDPDAERRRQRALQALDARMAELAPKPT